jgi:hypothetical protein
VPLVSCCDNQKLAAMANLELGHNWSRIRNEFIQLVQVNICVTQQGLLLDTRCVGLWHRGHHSLFDQRLLG